MTIDIKGSQPSVASRWESATSSTWNIKSLKFKDFRTNIELWMRLLCAALYSHQLIKWRAFYIKFSFRWLLQGVFVFRILFSGFFFKYFWRSLGWRLNWIGILPSLTRMTCKSSHKWRTNMTKKKTKTNRTAREKTRFEEKKCQRSFSPRLAERRDLPVRSNFLSLSLYTRSFSFFHRSISQLPSCDPLKRAPVSTGNDGRFDLSLIILLYTIANNK